MLFRVITKHDGIQKIHFRSHNLNDCWSFIDRNYSKQNAIVVDNLDRKIKRPEPQNKLKG